MTGRRLIMHRPRPGPLYWDWRCLDCSARVDEHAPWWRLVLFWLFGGGR